MWGLVFRLQGIRRLQIDRSYFKKRIFVRDHGEAESQPAGIRRYVEDLRRGLNADIGRKDFFEMVSSSHLMPVISFISSLITIEEARLKACSSDFVSPKYSSNVREGVSLFRFVTYAYFSHTNLLFRFVIRVPFTPIKGFNWLERPCVCPRP